MGIPLSLSFFFPYVMFAPSWLDSQKENTVIVKRLFKRCNLKGEDKFNYLEQYHDFPKGDCKNIIRELQTPRKDSLWWFLFNVRQ